MKFIREIPAGHVITGHGAGHVDVGNRRMERSFALCGEFLLDDWPVAKIADLAVEDFAPLLAWKPEIVLLGSGLRHRFPASGIARHFHALGLGFEVMDTAAACRTYNIILGEGRRVAAALIVGD